MSRVNVRYIVSDVDAAIPFYTDMLDFKVVMHPAPGLRKLVARGFTIAAQPAGCRRGLGKLCRLVSFLVQAAGTEYRSKSTT